MFITNSILPLLDYNKINFNLFWVLFKLNIYIFTIYKGLNQLKCLIYNLGNFKTSIFGEKSFKLNYHHFGYNRKAFSKVKTTFFILKFRLTIKIISLNIFLLECYKKQAKIKQDFISNG